MRFPAFLFLLSFIILTGCQPERGCTNPAAHNYNPEAVEDDGSCSTDPIIGGHTYPVVQIGDQTWFAENLRTTTYANGDPIRSGLTAQEWKEATSGATTVYGEADNYCSHDSPEIDACNEVQSLSAYGRLYNWYAVDDERGLCPNGWHVPSDDEWMEAFQHMAMAGDATGVGAAMKSTSGWMDGGDGTDEWGFAAVPHGRRRSCCGDFKNAGASSCFWTSTPYEEHAWFWGLDHDSDGIGRGIHWVRDGFAVRCIKDAD